MNPAETHPDDPHGSSLAERLESNRRQSAEFFEGRRKRWDNLQSTLVGELDRIATSVDAWDEVHHEVEQQHLEVRKERQRLERDRVQLEERSCELDEQRIELERDRKRVQKEIEQQKKKLTDAAESRQAELTAEIESLQNQLASLDQRSNEVDLEKLQLAMQEAEQQIAALQQQNESLQSQLEHPTASPDLGGAFDWEAQKAQLMQESESMPPLDRLTVNKALEVTSRVVEAKEKELATLRERLQEQSAAGETATNSAFQSDEEIQKECQRLRELQVELREKAREAEVAIAVERAENARARAKLEEKTRELESQARMLAKFEKENISGRRWLDHLGLNSKD